MEACLASVARVLHPGGWLVFASHIPVFEAPQSEWIGKGRLVTNYYAEGFWRSDGPESIRSKVGAHHRTLATFINTLTAAGFTINRCEAAQ